MLNASFPHYLLSKQSVDDRAINKDVLEKLKSHLPSKPFSIVEVGAGIGTMLARLLRWNVISNVEYTLVDEMAANIDFGINYLPQWAVENGFIVRQTAPETFHLHDKSCSITAKFILSDVFEYIKDSPAQADILIAHAFLDLMPLPESLPKLFSLTKNLAWLTINFDGVSSFEPVIDPVLDSAIEQLYHQSMDQRAHGGDSRSGRHLFKYLNHVGAKILDVGSSDWVIYPRDGEYYADEANFLNFIFAFIEKSLKAHPDLDQSDLMRWLQIRREQISLGKLVYIAHQLDFLVSV
jgi:hypothetical protein